MTHHISIIGRRKVGGQRPAITDPDHDGHRWSYPKNNEDSSLPPTPPHIGHCRSPILLPCCFYFFYFLRRGIRSLTIGIIYQVQQYDDITPCRNRWERCGVRTCGTRVALQGKSICKHVGIVIVYIIIWWCSNVYPRVLVGVGNLLLVACCCYWANLEWGWTILILYHWSHAHNAMWTIVNFVFVWRERVCVLFELNM